MTFKSSVPCSHMAFCDKLKMYYLEFRLKPMQSVDKCMDIARVAVTLLKDFTKKLLAIRGRVCIV